MIILLETKRLILLLVTKTNAIWDQKFLSVCKSKHCIVKNRFPHKALNGKAPREVLFKKNPMEERKFLRPFGEKVVCYDYNFTGKLGARSFKRENYRIY